MVFDAIQYLVDLFIWLFNPSSIIGWMLTFVGYLLWGVCALFGQGGNPGITAIKNFCTNGPIPILFDLAFYFASPMVNISVIRPLVGLLMVVWPVVFMIKCAIWAWEKIMWIAQILSPVINVAGKYLTRGA